MNPDERRARAQADLAFFEVQLATLEAADRGVKQPEDDPRRGARTMALAFYRAMADWARAVRDW